MPIVVENQPAPSALGAAAFQAGLGQWIARQRQMQAEQEALAAQMAQRERLAMAGLAADRDRMAYGRMADLERMFLGAGLDERKMLIGADIEGARDKARADAELEKAGLAEEGRMARMLAKERGAREDKLRDFTLGIGEAPLAPRVLKPFAFKRKIGEIDTKIAAAAEHPDRFSSPAEMNAYIAGLEREKSAYVEEEPPPKITNKSFYDGAFFTDHNGKEVPPGTPGAIPWVTGEDGNPKLPDGYKMPPSPEEIRIKREESIAKQYDQAIKALTKQVPVNPKDPDGPTKDVAPTPEEIRAYLEPRQKFIEEEVSARESGVQQPAGAQPQLPLPIPAGGEAALGAGLGAPGDPLAGPPPPVPPDSPEMQKIKAGLAAQAQPPAAPAAAAPAAGTPDPFGPNYGADPAQAAAVSPPAATPGQPFSASPEDLRFIIEAGKTPAAMQSLPSQHLEDWLMVLDMAKGQLPDASYRQATAAVEKELSKRGANVPALRAQLASKAAEMTLDPKERAAKEAIDAAMNEELRSNPPPEAAKIVESDLAGDRQRLATAKERQKAQEAEPREYVEEGSEAEAMRQQWDATKKANPDVLTGYDETEEFQKYYEQLRANAPVIRSDDELAKLPLGTLFIDAKGQVRPYVHFRRMLEAQGLVGQREKITDAEAKKRLPVVKTWSEFMNLPAGYLFRNSQGVVKVKAK